MFLEEQSYKLFHKQRHTRPKKIQRTYGVGIPSWRLPPLSLGISILRTGFEQRKELGRGSLRPSSLIKKAYYLFLYKLHSFTCTIFTGSLCYIETRHPCFAVDFYAVAVSDCAVNNSSTKREDA